MDITLPLWLIFFSLAILGTGLLVAWEVRRASWMRAIQIAEYERHRLIYAANRVLDDLKDRYSIQIVDWGPDFSGEEGTLPRYRWVIVDADYNWRLLLAGDLSEIGPMPRKVYMVGNASTYAQAGIDALAWIERQEIPQYLVTPVVPAPNEVSE